MKAFIFISALAFSVATLFGGQSALAFQETEITMSKPSAISPVVSDTVQQSKSQFNGPNSDVVDEKERTSIRIPGFGVIGTMPKLNFGLELLYRDEEDTGIVGNSEPDDLSIKGTLKHKF